jgi:hypothetical protein
MSDKEHIKTVVDQPKTREEELAEQLAEAHAIIRQKNLEILELKSRLNQEHNLGYGFFT